MSLLPLPQEPFVSGGIVLMILGSVFYYLKSLPRTLGSLIERFFLLKLEIRDEDESFQWLQLWLADKLRSTLSTSVLTRRATSRLVPFSEEDSAVNKPRIVLVPAVGRYFFWFSGRLVALQRDRRESPSIGLLAGRGSGAAAAGRDRESYIIRIFSRNRDLARRLIEECREKALPDDGKIDILIQECGDWSLAARVKPRPLDSVILHGKQTAELLADMKEFLARKAWYEKVGVPYRRGYLLHGPPGNGKTSVVKALAGELRLHIYLLMLSDPLMNDNQLYSLLSRMPEKTILLLEDVDCAFLSRQRARNEKSALTFSGLLNALDGVAAPEGRIVVMTTNHVERLDPALIRPGRTDRQLFFGNATTDQARRLFERFFPEHQVLAAEFAHQAGNGQHSMAQLQEYLSLHQYQPEQAVRQVAEIGQHSKVSCFNGHIAYAEPSMAAVAES